MQKIIFILKIVVIVAYCCSCSPGKAITGEITGVKGREVQCAGSKFLLLPNAPDAVVGQRATFKPTKSKKKVNCKLLK